MFASASEVSIEATVYLPPRMLGAFLSFGVSIWSAFLVLICFNIGISNLADPRELASFVLVILFLLLGITFFWWGINIWRLSYSFRAGNLIVRWGLRRIVIPISEIREVVSGFEVGKIEIGGLNWWGCHVGTGFSERFGEIQFFSTHNSVEENVVIVTDRRAYSLTIDDINTFYQDYLSRYRASAKPVSAEEKTESVFGMDFPIWDDKSFQALLGFAAVPFLGILIYTYIFYERLPSAVRIFFPEAKSIVEIFPREELLKIVYVALVIFFCNIVFALMVHFRARSLSIWLLFGGGIFNSLLLAALIIAFENG